MLLINFHVMMTFYCEKEYFSNHINKIEFIMFSIQEKGIEIVSLYAIK